MNLFKQGYITLHSGAKSSFKIECDSLTDDDLECIASLIALIYQFGKVYGVPTGGEKLANELKKYEIDDFLIIGAGRKLSQILIIDDVLTTGNSMAEYRKKICEENAYAIEECLGIVIFARGKCPDWITPIFNYSLNEQ
jgi:hypothetical protein